MYVLYFFSQWSGWVIHNIARFSARLNYFCLNIFCYILGWLSGGLTPSVQASDHSLNSNTMMRVMYIMHIVCFLGQKFVGANCNLGRQEAQIKIYENIARSMILISNYNTL